MVFSLAFEYGKGRKIQDMRHQIILVIGLVAFSAAHCQWDQKKYDSLLEKGASSYEAGSFRESALFYEASLRMLSKPSTWNRLVTARSWAKANYIDSAFYHLDLFAASDWSTLPGFPNVLTDDAFRNLHGDTRWKVVDNYVTKNYILIANRFSERIRSGNWTHPTNDGYDAARAWAAAGEKDSSFNYLYRIVTGNYNTFIDYPKITRDNYLISLHGDTRWPPLIDIVKRNWTWIPTRHSFSAPAISMSATIDPGSSHLKSDELGSYMDGVDKVVSKDQHGYNLELSGHRILYQSGNRKDLSTRHITLDLNSPVTSTGALPMGKITDNDLELHVLYRMDTTLSPQVVYNFREIPVGTSIESERTEIIFYINNIAHLLSFGPWGFGRNNEAIAHKGRINGIGTTMVNVRRHGKSDYTIYTPEVSIGRLWQVQNLSNPIDMGLYNVGFKIHIGEQ
jgi:hypothetical protein